MAQINLRALTGRETGTRPARRMRAEGMVPGIVYGKGIDPIPVTVDHHDLQVALRTEAGRNVLINLDLDQGSTYLTLARQIDRHPFKNMIRHVDFVHVSLTEKVRAQVLVHFEGTPAGLKEGGILAPGHTLIEIEALPTDIPSRIDLDISDLHIGHHMRVADLPAIPGVEYLDEPDEIVVTVSIPAAEIAAAVEEAAEGEVAAVETEAEAEE